MPCIILESCEFYKVMLSRKTEQTQFLIDHYCQTDFGQCVRYKIYRELGANFIPSELTPTNYEQYSEILRIARKQRDKEKHSPGSAHKDKKPGWVNYD